jgi:hypothetical protein
MTVRDIRNKSFMNIINTRLGISRIFCGFDGEVLII